jgi:hypothetical protein
MNGLTKEIAAQLGISIADAVAVQEILESPGNIDTSECTQKQLTKAINEAYGEFTGAF